MDEPIQQQEQQATRRTALDRKRLEVSVAIISCVTKEDVFTITAKAIQQAKGGDRFAREWLFNRMIGSVTSFSQVEVTGHALTADEQRERLDQILGLVDVPLKRKKKKRKIKAAEHTDDAGDE